ncbi:peptide ABC transporter substrate-binding protein [Carnobacterium gallinarum]|uniref:peptide ABC transporter substrate-binding protein n=1 Tax=Carnobacterium gallinarum TaxID=2749 RepID=UPI00054CDCC6|nr:peptide ABC transporter substrate-binding protein [Carnobacterium gallinarum]
MKIQKKWLGLGLALSFGILAVGCSNNNNSKSTSSESTDSSQKKLAAKQELNLTEIAELPTGDTALATDTVSFTVFNQVLEGLYRLDKESQPIPALAKEEVKVSEDGLTYNFKLREGAKWSNGDNVTAKDFVYAWQRVVNPATGSQYAYLFDGIENADAIIKGEKTFDTLGVKAISDYEFEVKMEKPVPYFVSLMAFPTFFPQNEKFVTEKKEKYGTSAENMIFNGPFVFKGWTGTNLSWQYEKNPNYWDNKNVYLDKINVDVIKETATALNLYDADKLDRVLLTGEYAKQYQDDPAYKVVTEARSAYMQYNQVRDGKKTIFANENMRKAVAYSYDQKLLANEILANGSKVLTGFVPADLAKNPTSGEDFRKESGSYLQYDKKKAQDYWEAAKKELGGDKFSIDLTADDDETNKKISAFLKDQIEGTLPGLTVNVRSLPFKVRLEAGKTQNYDLMQGGWGADFADPVNFIDLLQTDSPYNRSSYSNAEFDKLLADSKGVNAVKPEARWKNLLDAEKILLDQAGVSPLYQRAAAELQKPYVKDIYAHQVGAKFTYKNAYIEEQN